MITDDEMKGYLDKVGKRGLGVLATIQSLSPIIDAMKTPMGEMFLKDDIENHAALINKIYESLIKEGKAEQCDVIHLQMLDARLKRIYGKIANYDSNMDKVRNNKT